MAIESWQRVHPRHALWSRRQPFDETSTRRLLCSLDEELDWQRPEITLFGKRHPIPRSQVWMGAPDRRYRYSRTLFTPSPWRADLAELCQRVDAEAKALAASLGWPVPAPLDSVLINRYQDGDQRMGWHSDDEPELGPDPLIVSLSLGAARVMRFRPRPGTSGEPFDLSLEHGALLVMGPGVQRELQHALPPRKGAGLRINLTFRAIRHPAG
ncbi:alpha-ketoglutarate-dependent dioxygenase AlkB family protein [Halotalea alkalilenta]|uniref:alpha-ketoglutarate-dependent dioxygenase AlkB family protein n=1 Tax=Halotalea alkalilenta TaxID=376489 RepID=UPI0005B9834D|nr:alpha-ketoglutarate-dependent dioxygenase AlkB [Halotalea alkalilenta]